MRFDGPTALIDARARPWSREPRITGDTFRFVLLADRTGGAQPGVFERALQQTNLLAPDFVISIGDLIEGYTRDAAALAAQWAEMDAWLTRLDAPLFVIPGNHDVSSEQMQQIWRTRYGADYYHFTLGDCLFLCLSTDDPPRSLTDELLEMIADMKQRALTDPVGVQAEVRKMVLEDSLGPSSTVSEEQIACFEQVLADHPDPRWTFVLAHKPAWAHPFRPWERLEAMIRLHCGSRFTAFAGHQHRYKYETRGGVDYIRVGATGAKPLVPGDGALEHVALVTMQGPGASRPRIANLTLDGILDVSGQPPGAQDCEPRRL